MIILFQVMFLLMVVVLDNEIYTHFIQSMSHFLL